MERLSWNLLLYHSSETTVIKQYDIKTQMWFPFLKHKLHWLWKTAPPSCCVLHCKAADFPPSLSKGNKPTWESVKCTLATINMGQTVSTNLFLTAACHTSTWLLYDRVNMGYYSNHSHHRVTIVTVAPKHTQKAISYRWYLDMQTGFFMFTGFATSVKFMPPPKHSGGKQHFVCDYQKNISSENNRLYPTYSYRYNNSQNTFWIVSTDA